MKIAVSEENKKRMFIIAYVIYLFSVILFSSKYGEMSYLKLFFPFIRITAYFLICCKLLMDFLEGCFSINEIMIIGLIGVLLIIVAYVTKDKNMLIYWAFIVAAHDVEFSRIIKWSLWVHLVGLFLIIGSSYLQILENRIYYQDGGTRIRESLGFQYTTESSNYFFYTILLWIYWRRERVTWKEIIAMLCISIFLFWKTDTKNSFLLGVAAIIGTLILKYIKYLRDYKKIYSVIAVGIVPMLAFTIVGLSAKFDASKAWMKQIDKLITGRLFLAKKGYEEYGIHLLGQRIEWIGGKPPEGKVYNYVDSSYMQILLNFGVVLFILLLLALIILGICITKNKDTYFLLVFVMFTLHSTFDPQLVWIGYNSFIMAYSYINGIERKKGYGDPTAKCAASIT